MNEAIYHEMARIEREHWWFVAKRHILRSLIMAFVQGPPGTRPRVADIGCGTGALLEDLAPNCDVVGLDSSETARHLCAAKGLRVLRCWLPADLPIDDGSFDAVVMSDVLEHVAEDGPAARVAAGKLKPGGVLVVTVPAHPWMWTSHDDVHHHQRRYTKRGLASVLDETGLVRERLSYYNAGLFAPMMVARMVGKWRGGGSRAGSGVPPWPVNAVLRGVFGCERHLLPRVPLPFGASLAAVYRKRDVGP